MDACPHFNNLITGTYRSFKHLKFALNAVALSIHGVAEVSYPWLFTMVEKGIYLQIAYYLSPHLTGYVQSIYIPLHL